MLSITECRRYLKNCAYSTKEVEEIRDCLHQLANLLVNDYLSDEEEAKSRMKVNGREQRCSR